MAGLRFATIGTATLRTAAFGNDCFFPFGVRFAIFFFFISNVAATAFFGAFFRGKADFAFFLVAAVFDFACTITSLVN
jgi:hypothetical protein